MNAMPLRNRGLSLLELMVGLALVGVMMSIAIPGYQRYQDRARAAQAVNDIGQMSVTIERYRTRVGRLPDALDDVDLDDRLDPWGRSYVYFNFATFAGMGPDPTRRDRNLKPLNTDYDLYSRGKDGQSQKQLNASASEDDIVRALDGSFIGLGKDF
jgi:general secretion pathway protein G